MLRQAQHDKAGVARAVAISIMMNAKGRHELLKKLKDIRKNDKSAKHEHPANY
jgi:hypothetical protein